MSWNAAFGRGRPPRWLLSLASSVALLAALAPSAHAYVFDEPEVRAIGPEQVVFDYSTMRCSPEDIPDSPARAFRDSQNRVQLIASHASVRRKVGPTLDTVQHQCPIVLDSHGNQDPAMFDDREWLSSVYTTDGQTIYGLMSTEYHGWEYDEACAPFVQAGQHLKCWYNSIGLTKSVNGGASYSHAVAPAHRVANSPYPYATGNGPDGIFDPSNIVYRPPPDGHYYVMVRAEPRGAQQQGACLLRTQNLDDPTSWRAWDGSGFTRSFINPYTSSAPPAEHVCEPVSPGSFDHPIQTGSLTWSTYLNKYVLLGVSQRYDPVAQRWNGGFFYSLSSNLINWTPMKVFMEAQMPWTHRCGEPDPVRDPSLIDPASESRSFETIGRQAYLYFTRFNMVYFNATTCWADLDRDLIRIPIEFTDTSVNQIPVASFTPSPNPALTNQSVTFNGSASSDPDGTIVKYEWDLDGNGSFETNTGSTPTASMSYPTPRTVTAGLRVTDNRGGTNSTTRSLNISNRPPAASFTASPNPVEAGQVVTFDGSASSDPDGTIVRYEWDLDGNGSFETDTGSAATATRAYAAAATVVVGLRVNDSDGGTSQTTRTLMVNPPPPTNQLPAASFAISPNPVPTGAAVSFDGSASSDPDGTITNYRWDLDGNGSFETDAGSTPSASRSYPCADVVSVKLRVTDSDGATSDTSRTLTVTNRTPAAAFTAAPNPAEAGQVVTFNGSGSSDPDGSIARYEWDLDGNGSFETDAGSAATTMRAYAAAATVVVGLRVTDNDGGTSNASHSLTVNAPVPGPPGPLGPPAPPGPLVVPKTSPTPAQCAGLRAKRTAVTKKLRKARQGLARARSARAKRRYGKLIRKLIRQRKRLVIIGCPR